MEGHTYSDLRDFVEKTKAALVHEKEAEIVQFEETVKTNTAKNLQLMGLAMTGLKLRSIKGGLYGRTLLTLTHHLHPKDDTTDRQILDKSRLPECRFGAGDNIGIYDNSEYIYGKPLVTGVVHRKSQQKLIISVEGKEQGEDIEGAIQDKFLSACSTINQVTYSRYAKALGELYSTDATHRARNVIQSLFNYAPYPVTLGINSMQFVDQTLNQEQKQAVMKCISTGSVHLVHGPPGTGKTKTICEVIVQAAKRDWKVLAAAGSNIAVDNIVERIGKNVKVCRIGHPSRMIQKVYGYCLDNLLFKSTFHKVLKEIKRELDQMRVKYMKTGERAQRRQLKDKIKATRSQIRGIEEAAVKEVLDESQVICCTNAGAGERMFRRELASTVFDLVVIDQCAQSVEVSCWIPLLKGKRAVLAGDHLQLPPTIKSSEASKVLGYTLFDRAMKECPVGSTLLTTQYRMNESIMNWSSQQFYEGKLLADASVCTHTTKDISALALNPIPLMYIDTAGCQMGQNLDREASEVSKSKFNLGQADLVIQVCKQLIAQGLKNDHIGVITPYNAQVSLIKGLMESLQTQNDKIQVSTVDGFQGREKECIIISMVRSNPAKQVGFLSDQRRMNVAITRAKRFICLIGDSQTVTKDPSLKTLVQYFTLNGQSKNAIEYDGDENVRFGLGWTKHQKKQQEKEKEKVKRKLSQKDGQKKDRKKKNKKKPDNSKEIVQIDEQQLQEQIKGISGEEENRASMPELKSIQNAEQVYVPMIEAFLTSPDKQLVFEKLSGFDRKIVHSICEALDLGHQTSADKNQLTVSKHVPVDMDENQRQAVQQLAKGAIQSNIRFLKLQADTRKQISRLAKQLDLDTVYDYLTQELKITKIRKVKPLAVEKPQPKKKAPSKKEPKEQIDDMEFLQQLQADQKRCHYPTESCKTKVEHLGMRCQFCDEMFCVKHCLAQSHGCGQKAQTHARQRHRAEYLKSTGVTLSNKEKSILHQKLQKKLKEAEKDRQQGKKDKK